MAAGKELEKVESSPAALASAGLPSEIIKVIKLLPEEQKKEFLSQFARGGVEIAIEALRQDLNNAQLCKTLGDLAQLVQGVSNNGNAITVTHVQTTATSQTTVVMGTPKIQEWFGRYRR